MKTLLRSIPALSILAAMTAYAGGWATVTVRHLPEFVFAGEVTTLDFIVRQHGVTPLDGVSATIRATSSDSRVVSGKVFPSPIKGKGEYMARITLPDSGDWKIEIASAWARSATVLAMTARAKGSGPAAPLSEVERGERSFASKACNSCHGDTETGTSTWRVGPNLAARTFPVQYLQQLLANPATAGKEMPNQELTSSEIKSLVAFINRKR